MYDDKLVFKNSGKIFNLKGDFLEMITDYEIKTDSPDLKLLIDIMDGMHFDINCRGKCLRDRNLIKNFFNERSILAFRLKTSETTFFLSENPNDLCDRLCLIIQEKQAGNDTTRFENDTIAIFDEFLQYKTITPTQPEKLN